MTVSRIEAHRPNVILVEKTISRQAQEKLLAKDISFVLNMKRSLLERIARCTGAEIVPSPDHLLKATSGHCDSFHVDKIEEELGSNETAKNSTKTLMFFEGCPRPLGCTVSIINHFMHFILANSAYANSLQFLMQIILGLAEGSNWR
jgi:1-phosphatidylinositol-3-phosphate 5-kinase